MRYLPLFPILFACSGENIIEKQQNSAPIITIPSHTDGAEILEGYVASFRAQVSDEDNDFGELEIAWFVGEEEVCPWTTASEAGESFCDIVFTPDDTSVVAEVRDIQGMGGRSEISIIVLPTQAPVIEILSPVQNQNYYADQLVEFSALVSDPEDDVSDLIISWTSSVDGELSLSTEADSSGEITDYEFLTEGQHAIELRVEDSTGKITTESVVVNVGGNNNEPLCEIIEPESGAAYILGQNISFSGVAADEDINNSLLDISWESNLDSIFDTSSANTAGEIIFVHNGLSSGNHTITLRVEDEAGGFCTDTALVAVGTPPLFSLISPVNGDIVSLGEPIFFTATVSDNEDISSAISLSWVSDIDGEFSTQGPDSNGNIAFSESSLSAGPHNLTITATDSTGLTTITSLSLRINTPPPAPGVVLSPAPLTSADTLTATISNGIDIDGDTITTTYAWYEDSVLTSITGLTVPSSELDIGETWTIRVTPHDGHVSGNYTEETIVVSNSAPVISSISVTPNGPVYNDSLLVCSAVATDNDEMVTPTIEWTVGGNTYSGGNLDLSVTSAMPTDMITCTATVMDSNGGMDSASTTLTIGNRSPAVSNINISPNTTVLTNSSLSCLATITDDDGETLFPAYEWTMGGGVLGTSDTFLLSNTFVQPGDILTCTAAAEDNYGGSISDYTSVTVQNSDPTIDSITITPSVPTQTDTLSCTATASDIDGGSPLLSFLFLNQSSGASYTATTASATNATLDLSGTNALTNDVIECLVTATDTHNGSSSASTTVTIINSAPSFLTAATITPSAGVSTGTSLLCTAAATDIDDGSITPTYSWSVGSNIIGIGNTYIVDATDTDVGNVITCTATAIDSDNEMTLSMDSVTLQNTLPVVSAVSISPNSSIYNDSILSCTSTIVDPDENLTPIYTWSIGSSIVGNSSSIDLATTAALPTDIVYCDISVSDSQGGTDSGSANISVDNRAPAITSLTITPLSPIVGVDDLVCTATALDDDGHSPSYTYSWTSDMGSSASGNTVPASSTTAGETWTCTVDVTDGIDITSDSIDVTVNIPFSTVTFTSCGKSGPFGPDQSHCDAEYLGTTLENMVSVFSGIQEWTVPATGTYSIEVWGGEGSLGKDHATSYYSTGIPGKGAYLYGEFALTAGDILTILVGQEGLDNTLYWQKGGGGGGGTFVAMSNNTPLIVAGGGGGSGRYDGQDGGDGLTTTAGSAGPTGGPGGTNGNGGSVYSCGYGGNSGAGFYGNGLSDCGNGYFAYSFVNGGQGGEWSNCWIDGNDGGFGGGGGSGPHGGAGGGGYSGGGGGGDHNCGSTPSSGGGGGGSYNAGSNQQASPGFNIGNGQVVINLIY